MNTKDKDTITLFSQNKVLELLEVSPVSLYNFVKKGYLELIKVESKNYYISYQVYRFIDGYLNPKRIKTIVNKTKKHLNKM